MIPSKTGPPTSLNIHQDCFTSSAKHNSQTDSFDHPMGVKASFGQLLSCIIMLPASPRECRLLELCRRGPSEETYESRRALRESYISHMIMTIWFLDLSLFTLPLNKWSIRRNITYTSEYGIIVAKVSAHDRLTNRHRR